MAKRISPLRRLAACALAALLLIPALPPVTSQAANANATTHYSYTTKKGNSTHSMSALPNNLIYGANRNRTDALRINSGHLYLPEGREYIPSWSMYAYVTNDKSRDPATQGDANHAGLPYRAYTFTDSNGTTYYKTAIADLEFELAEMPALDTTGLGAVNLSIVTAVDPTAYGATGVDYDRQLQVYVSTDGETWLDGYAGVRSSTLLGGGEIRYEQSSVVAMDGMFYRVETEDLLSSIPDLQAGDTIQKIKILPHGANKRSSTWFTINNIDVNTWATAAAFTSAIPSDVTYTSVATNVLRWNTVVEARRLLDITYQTTAPIYVSKATGGGSTQLAEPGVTTYAPGTYTGPIYKRGTTATREALENAVVDGVYVGPYGTLASDGQTVEVDNAIGMDCQTFVYNAISRVSRTNAWSVAASPMASYSSIPGGIKTAEYPAFTDIDIVNKNTKTQMFKNYAAAGAGDLLIVYLANYSNSVHTRLVTRVDTTNQRIYFIDQSSGRTPCVQESYASFADLYAQKYVVVTLDEYAQGKLANADLEMVVGSSKEGLPFQTGCANVAVSSNYRINDYQVKILDSAKAVKYDSGKILTPGYRTRAFNHQSAELNTALSNLPAGNYTLAVTANSGPYTSNSQTSAYHTVEQAFTVAPPSTTHNHVCDHGHASFGSAEGWTPLSTVMGQTTDHPVLTSGNYYVDRDLDLGEFYIKIEGDVNLCLNGHTITRTPPDPTAAKNCWIFKVKDTNDGLPVTFNLCDCSEEQTGAVGTDWTSKNTSATDAVAIVRNGGIFNFYGGKITGSTTRNTVYVAAGGTFNLKGGEISGNTTTASGVVNIISGGTFVADSGSISGNTLPTGINAVTGLAGATVNPGATIQGYHVHDCVHGHDGYESGFGWTDLTPLVNNATAALNLPAGNYYLSGDADSKYEIDLAGSVNLCLNGHTISRSDDNGSYIFKITANDVVFNVCDCSAEQTGIIGPFTSKKSSATESAVIVRMAGTEFNLWSGTITGIEAATAVYIAGGNTFNMYGGSITGNTTVSLESKKWGAVHVASGTFNMYDGAVTGNILKSGATSQVTTTSTGTFNHEGGTVSAHAHNCGHADHVVTGDWLPLSSVTDGVHTANMTLAGNYYLDKDITLDGLYFLINSDPVNICLNGHTLTRDATTVDANGNCWIFKVRDNDNSATVTLNICDCSEGETGVIGSGWVAKNNANTDAVMIVRKNATANLYGGTITGATTATTVYVAANGTFNMKGGKITGNTTVPITSGTKTYEYGSVFVASGGAFNMTGGEISDNDTASGTQITGTYTNNGGTIVENPDDSHPHACGHDHATAAGPWIPFSTVRNTNTRTTLTGGRYYLDSDVVLNNTTDTNTGDINFTGNSVFCLNGYTISGGNVANMFRTDGTVTVDICDCAGTGKITGHIQKGTTQAPFIVRNGGTVNLYGGTYTGNSGKSLFYLADGNATLNIYGGTIADNTSEAEVYFAQDGSSVAGTAQVVLYGTETVTASTAKTMYYYFNPSAVAGRYTLGASRPTVRTHTHTCTNGHEVTGEWLPLSDVLDGMTAAKAIPAGNYFLDKDLTIPAKFLQVADGTTVNLCLNGHKLKGCTNQGYILYLTSGTLNICDCVGGGTIGEGWDGLTNTSSSAFSVIRADSGTTLNLYAGSITGVKDSHGIVYLMGGATFNMYGGAITDNNSLRFSAVRMAGNTAQFNMTGGTISGNVCADTTVASQITCSGGFGNININGGTVVDTHNHSCGHGHDSFGTEWKPLSYFVKTSGNTVLTSGNYYLDRDITLPSGYIAIDGGADVKLCLNGFNLNGVQENSYIFFMGSTSGSNNNTLSICDCTDTGTLGDGWISADGATASTNIRHLAVVRVGGANVSGNTLNLYGGTITNITAGSAVFVNSGNTLNIYDAKIINNTIKGTGGAAVYNRGQANLYGGEISNNTHELSAQASSRGAVATDQATAVTYISGTKVSTPHENQAVASAASDATVTIVGGKFSKEPKAEFVADGYVLAETGDETYGWTVVPQLITGATVENGEALDLKVTVDVSTLEDELNTYTVSMTKGGVETTGTLNELLTYDEVTLTHHLTFPDVAAKEMGDSIAVTVTDTDGEVVTAHSFTVAEQFKNILASTDDQAVINLCVDALNYGAAAQQRFEHNTDALVNADVTATSTTVTGQWTDNLSITEGYEALYAATASLKEKLELNMYFDVDCANGVPAVTVSGAVSHVASTVTNGTKQILKVALKEIAPKDAKNPISVTVEADEGTIQVTDSLAGYIVRNVSERDQAVLAALKRYIDSAIALANQAG